MTTNHRLAIAVLASSLAAAVGGWEMHAQQTKTAPVYIISEADTITDITTIKKYGEGVPGTLVPFAGQLPFCCQRRQRSESRCPSA